MISKLWLGPAAVIGGLVFWIGPAALAQQNPAIPSFTGERVIVAGVPDQFGAIAGQITRLEKASPQSYYVVIVKSTGTDSSATRKFTGATGQELARAKTAAWPIVRPREVRGRCRGSGERAGYGHPRHVSQRSVRPQCRKGRARSDPRFCRPGQEKTAIKRRFLHSWMRPTIGSRSGTAKRLMSRFRCRPRSRPGRNREHPLMVPKSRRSRARGARSSRRDDGARGAETGFVRVAAGDHRGGSGRAYGRGLRGLDLAFVPSRPGPRGRADQGDQVEGG